jgi:hypothetical protein
MAGTCHDPGPKPNPGSPTPSGTVAGNEHETFQDEHSSGWCWGHWPAPIGQYMAIGGEAPNAIPRCRPIMGLWRIMQLAVSEPMWLLVSFHLGHKEHVMQ